MKKITLCLALVLTFIAGMAFAGGTLDQAKAMGEQAAAYFAEAGQEKAFAAFNDPKGKFVKGDLYVFVGDFNGKILAHGANAKLIGQSLMDIKDPSPAGKLFMVEFVDVAKNKGAGWVDYMWSNPETKKIEPKSTYIVRLKGKDLFIGCGAYGKR
jgi:signal transduction histidine kinase